MTDQPQRPDVRPGDLWQYKGRGDDSFDLVHRVGPHPTSRRLCVYIRTARGDQCVYTLSVVRCWIVEGAYTLVSRAR